MTTFLKSVFLLLVAALGMAMGQSRVETNKAELSIPFGVATGHLVAIDDHLVFVNSEKPESSFAMDRSNISDVRVGDQTFTVRTLKPVRDISEFVFRVTDPTIVNSLVGWSKNPSPEAAKKDVEEQVAETYKVRHKHSVYGGCTGNLVVSSGRMSYESIDDIGHSRQWDLTNIKELKRKNPYEVEVRPFTGNGYDFELLQKGMSSRDYQVLADKITRQRAPK